MPTYTPPKIRYGSNVPGAKANPYGSLGPAPRVVTKVRLARAKQLPPARVQPRVLFPGFLTDRQIQAQAETEASRQYNLGRSAIIADVARLRADADRRRQLLTDAMMAAASANQAMAPGILQGYLSSAQALGGLAQGAVGAVGSAMRADLASQNQALAAVGQAPANIGDVAQQQGVEGLYGGYLPATNLATMGALANQGMLRETGLQRVEAAQRPWLEHEETIRDLDATELSELRQLAAQRPELVSKVLNRLTEQRKLAYSYASDVADRQAKSKQAKADLDYKYWSARQKATTAADKIALDRWYKNQQTKLDAFDSATRRINAQTGQGRLSVAQQNADTSATKATLAASGYMPLPEVMRTLQREQPETLQLNIATGKNIKAQKAKLVERLFTAYAPSVPAGQQKALKKMIRNWVKNLRVVKKSSGGGALAGYTKGARPGEFGNP